MDVDAVHAEETRLPHLLYHSNESGTKAVTHRDDTVIIVSASMETI